MKYNKDNAKPYLIDLAMGYAVYEPEWKMTADQFFQYVDKLMFEAKKKK